MVAAGYEDGNDADSLRHDPSFKLANGRLPDAAALCSQPTLLRLENTPGPRALIRMARALLAPYCASFRQVPRRITLDIDDTFDTVHGGQQLRLFNAYYDEYGFQPIVADRTSCCRATANHFRLMFHTVWLPWSLRSLMPKRSTWRVAQFDTLRLCLVKPLRSGLSQPPSARPVSPSRIFRASGQRRPLGNGEKAPKI